MAEGFLTPLSLLATIVKTAPDALVVVDGDGRIMFANEQTQRVFGYPRGELMGEPLETLLNEGGETEAVPAAESSLQHVRARGGALRCSAMGSSMWFAEWCSMFWPGPRVLLPFGAMIEHCLGPSSHSANPALSVVGRAGFARIRSLRYNTFLATLTIQRVPKIRVEKS